MLHKEFNCNCKQEKIKLLVVFNKGSPNKEMFFMGLKRTGNDREMLQFRCEDTTINANLVTNSIPVL